MPQKSLGLPAEIRLFESIIGHPAVQCRRRLSQSKLENLEAFRYNCLSVSETIIQGRVQKVELGANFRLYLCCPFVYTFYVKSRFSTAIKKKSNLPLQ